MTYYMQRNFYNLYNTKIFLDNSLLVTSIHSGNFYPAFFLNNLSSDLRLCRSMEDMFVNDLIDGIEDNRINFLKCDISRSVIDLNRDSSEIDLTKIEKNFPLKTELSPMVKAGIGLLPYKTPDGDITFKRKFTIEEVLFLIENYYTPWHANLRRVIENVWNQMGRVIIIDMHSMPDSKDLPDMVIGNKYGKTCDFELVDYFTYYLNKMGYSVEINKPYAGGFITREYCNIKRNIQTMQLEINRKLYMDEETFSKNHNFKKLKSNISSLLNDFSENLRVSDYKQTINE